MKVLMFFLLLFSIQPMNAQDRSSLDLSSSLNEIKTYGTYCGFAGKQPPSRIVVEELINTRNVTELENWLSSPNLVIQAYAAEAMIRLHNDGIKISHDVYQSVIQIKEKDDEIDTCSGCILNTLTVKEALKNFNFKDQG